LRIGNDIAERALAGIVGDARQRRGDDARSPVGDGGGDLVVGLEQRGLIRVLGVAADGR
jgi:hypothetical protein